MAYIITDDCIGCGACEFECPANCIAPKDDIYTIDADGCTECGECLKVCPVDAPVLQ